VKSVALKILLSLGVLAFFFGAAEITVRIMGEFDPSGNFYFKNRLIHPHEMPLKMVTERVAALQESEDSIVTYHDVLGWAPRPGSESANGLYRYNSQGIRSTVGTYADHPDSGTLRIALFGDSFTHGDDVPVEASWGAVLEEMLNQRGIRAEVLNFGVGGYGIDQAMLRFTQQGAAFSPHVVVFGFAPENLKRNLNLLRPLYDPRSGLPFAKPRFIVDGQGISLINVPVLPPEKLSATLRNIDNWELTPHEYFYDPADFRSSWWQSSKLLATVAALGQGDSDPWLMKRIIFQDRSEEQQLGWMVIQAFAHEVETTGAEFKIVHLPSHPEMELRGGLGRWTYQTFLDALDGQFEVVHPEAALLEAAGGDFTRIFAGHYNAHGNRIIAEAVSRQLAP
jgi:hypothetical protein